MAATMPAATAKNMTAIPTEESRPAREIGGGGAGESRRAGDDRGGSTALSNPRTLIRHQLHASAFIDLGVTTRAVT
jgi:hypothetical protein